ncbi:hypothetical protein EYZ11_000595 [Aspergillus tanneri]|uniref:DUF6594 domain-containing protein n=1 Tax=Aspergillus tanneri TaxID=1220188 RepID=A0A4S3JWS6_9EURO|nr:uncharacterized protein ATNIH1004_007682 [Aspergillus tanneri]KAA8646255.1 hypothetical protein ATNIH1004_007682 [Aspergillus tanneri]THC99897.1 hypothetical protein EYZ11_000595 [Aspergillus tanneri]
MPLYSGSSRSKKARKEGANRASTTSVVSAVSRSTSKGSKASMEKLKKENPSAQPAAPQSSVASSTSAPGTQDPRRQTTESDRKPPNVFEYLDEGESDSENSSSSEDGHDSRNPPASSVPPKTAYSGSAGRQTNSAAQGANGRSRTSSMRSKVSMDSHRSAGPYDVSPSTVPLQLARNNLTQRKYSVDGSYGPGPLAEGPNYPGRRNFDLTSTPEAYYPPRGSSSFHRPPFPPSPPQSPEEDLHRVNRRTRRNTKTSHVPSGYGLLSGQLSSPTDGKEPLLPPLYRRFENLNHRVLLHLQDEIAHIEEELHMLDEYEEMHRVATAEQEGTKILPASRRMDAQAQVYSSLHYRREEVMGTLILKTQQYNNALSAYSKVLEIFPRASEQDAETYRTWMKEHTPIATAETRFLDHTQDLISLAPRAALHSSNSPVYSAIIIASAAILLPLLSFAMIAEFSGRLLVVAMVGGAASVIASNYSTGVEHLVASQDGWRCATLYFGFMTVAAIFIP